LLLFAVHEIRGITALGDVGFKDVLIFAETSATGGESQLLKNGDLIISLRDGHLNEDDTADHHDQGGERADETHVQAASLRDTSHS
jgi:hypothetical protein